MKVRVIGIPDGIEDYPDFPTKSTFEKCIGREFVIAGFNENGLAELGIQSVTAVQGEKSGLSKDFLNSFQSNLTSRLRSSVIAEHWSSSSEFENVICSLLWQTLPALFSAISRCPA